MTELIETAELKHSLGTESVFHRLADEAGIELATYRSGYTNQYCVD